MSLYLQKCICWPRAITAILCITEWMRLTSQYFFWFYFFLCMMWLFNATFWRHDWGLYYSTKVEKHLVHFADAWSRDSFSFILTIFLLIVFHKLSEKDEKTAVVLSGLASGHLTVIYWSCSIAWWLSSSEATGPSAGQPITAPQPSAVDNYRSERVRMSLSPVRIPAPGAVSFFLFAVSNGKYIQ